MSDSIITICTHCGTKNRVPSERIRDKPRCARCHSELPAGAVLPVEATDASFDRELTNTDLPVLVDFWAPWCGPCRMVGPVLEQLASQYQGRLKVVKVNVDQNQAVAGRYQIRSIPTMMIFEKGVKRHELTGALPKQEIERQLRPFIAG